MDGFNESDYNDEIETIDDQKDDDKNSDVLIEEIAHDETSVTIEDENEKKFLAQMRRFYK